MSFQQGISGLTAASRNLEVIGNNVANANTVGAKSSRAEFADVYANASLHQNANTPGMGVQVVAVTQQFAQGSIRATDNPLDMAINGPGFFCVSSPSASRDLAFTRNGQFQLDANGFVTTNTGMRLQGNAIDPATGLSTGVLGDIQLPAGGVTPKATSDIKLGLNLDARTQAPLASMPAFAPGTPSSYASTTSTPVYDQQGNEHVLSTYYRRTAVDNQWDVYTTLDGAAVPAATAGVQDPVGRVSFLPNGTLDTANTGTLSGGALTAGALTLSLPYPTATLPLAPSTSTTAAPVTLQFTGSTQFGTAFGVNSTSQDGYAPGQLTGFGLDASGVIQARYSNGRTMPAAQLALADFRNMQGLAPVGNNLWRATPASGTPAIGTPGSAHLGAVQGAAVEDSNIDLTQQLVDMITAQRSYQANAQTLKTQDQMMNTLVNLR